MSDWTLRRAGADDAPALALIAQATFLETYAGVVAIDDMLAHFEGKCSAALFADWIAREDYTVILAEHRDGAAPLGFAALTPPDLPIPGKVGDIELRRIYVLATMHGTGLGPALMQAALDEARALGGGRMLLGVNGGNRRAQRFYEKQGYSVAGTRQFQVGSTVHDDLIYARAL